MLVSVCGGGIRFGEVCEVCDPSFCTCRLAAHTAGLILAWRAFAPSSNILVIILICSGHRQEGPLSPMKHPLMETFLFIVGL